MILSHVFVRRSKPAPRFAPTLFLGFVLMFTLLGQLRPVVGLVGLGTTSILAGALILLNRQSIWDEYKKQYRKQKGLMGLFTKPNELYYTINVWFLWPFIIFLGLVCIWSAYLISA